MRDGVRGVEGGWPENIGVEWGMWRGVSMKDLAGDRGWMMGRGTFSVKFTRKDNYYRSDHMRL